MKKKRENCINKIYLCILCLVIVSIFISCYTLYNFYSGIPVMTIPASQSSSQVGIVKLVVVESTIAQDNCIDAGGRVIARQDYSKSACNSGEKSLGIVLGTYSLSDCCVIAK